MKYIPDQESPKLNRKRFSSDIEVKPFRLTAQRENCVVKALFVGDQYVGDKSCLAMEDDNSVPLFSVPHTTNNSATAAAEKGTTFIDQINSFASPYLQPRLWAASSPTPEATSSSAGSGGAKPRRVENEDDDGLSWRQRFQRKLQAECYSRESSPGPQERRRGALSTNRTAAVGLNGGSEAIVGPLPARANARSSSTAAPAPLKAAGSSKPKASAKIIDIITEKIREDREADIAIAVRKKSAEESGGAADPTTAACSPVRPRRKISEYVFDKLQLERMSASRSHTPLTSAADLAHTSTSAAE